MKRLVIFVLALSTSLYARAKRPSPAPAVPPDQIAAFWRAKDAFDLELDKLGPLKQNLDDALKAVQETCGERPIQRGANGDPVCGPLPASPAKSER